MVVQHCLLAENAQRMLSINTRDRAKVSEKLSSGYRVNRAADDAAGLAISEKMRRQIRGLTQAALNAQDGISMVQTAEGALNEVHEMLQRMNELCVKSANDTLTYSDRAYIQTEIEALQSEIDRTGVSTTFNEIELLNGVPQERVTARTPSLSYSGFRNASLTQGTASSLACYSISPLQDGDILTSGSAYYCVNGPDPPPHQIIYDDDGNVVDEIIPGSSRYPYPITKDRAYKHVANQLTEANVEQTGSVTVTYSSSGDSEGKFYMQFHGPLEVTLQVGADNTLDDQLPISINPVNSSTLGVWSVDVTGPNGDGARESIEAVKAAIELNSKERSKLGAYQNRLEHTIRNLDNVVENTTAAESQIRDTDMAKMISDLSNKDIIIQAGQAMLAQANQTNQGVLSLLQ